jgi:lipoprotein signal peptidase
VKPDWRIWWPVPAAVAAVVADGLFKLDALRLFPNGETVGGFLAIGLHKNPGIAFDIPFKMPAIWILSLMIGAVLAHIAIANRKRHPDITVGSLLIIIGAAGNLFDRIVYGFTVDYFFVLGRLAINLSDLVILTGVAALLLASRRHRSHEQEHPDEPKRL